MTSKYGGEALSQKRHDPNPGHISVAMCTFNGAHYLRQQLESIATQTVPPSELIVCDDGSTDETQSIVDAFSRGSQFPVRLFRNSPNLGPAQNFAKAIAICSGSLIVLSDQDDIWRPEKLARLIAAFHANPSAIYAFSNADLVDDDGVSTGQTLWSLVGKRSEDAYLSRDDHLALLLRENFVTGAAMAFRSEFKETILPIPKGWMHDHWIGILGSVVSSGIPIAEPLFMYRRHAAQVCGVKKKTYWQEYRRSVAAGHTDALIKLRDFRALIERLEEKAIIERCDSNRVELLREKERHLVNRAKVRSSNHFTRLGLVLTEIATGRYRKYSNSPWSSALRDL